MGFCFWLTFRSRGACRLCLCGGCSQSRMLHTPFVVPGIAQDWAGWCNALAAGASDWLAPSNANSHCSGSVCTMPTSQIAPEENTHKQRPALSSNLLQLNVGVRGKAADMHKWWLHKTKLSIYLTGLQGLSVRFDCATALCADYGWNKMQYKQG